MTDRRRPRLDEATVLRVLEVSGVDPATVASCEELTGGTSNSVHRVRTTGGDGLVLKVAPDPDAPALGHERGLLRTEAEFYRAARGSAPVPEVVHADFTRTTVPADFLVMTECPGENWGSRRKTITGAERSGLRAELGRVLRRTHAVTGPGFGYPQLGLADTWRAAFLSMVDILLADADRFAVTPPVPPARIASWMRGHADLLDEVDRPALVHFDLWDGNILVEGGRITGLVDGERAFWGDPVADLVSVALFGDVEQDRDLLAGYDSGPFTPGVRLRLSMYRVYLYLVMLVEAVPRGYSGPGHAMTARSARKHLLAELGSP
ncbi:aminoglycoside phosphotransferase family protein [Umezawaea sp. Da 62-37]|uniref:phosphotransferase family protein n=1 Tax=Umezawaea sp. Da 62-37 TaxID=3075927 RepID=UPI0028F71F62|nr:aminoglycoside phosphotransferase family protein [Umezawaea sp. Da 62-37]WNV85499.1 aminoglycoside phosphotransferase family protein [Umezawaea sp. Da 62-37]